VSRPRSKQTVLIVEDDDLLRELFYCWLRDEYDVRMAEDGGQALGRFADGVDAALLDRDLPDRSGASVLHEWRERQSSCPVAVVSGLREDSFPLPDSIDAYLRKPVTETELVSLVESLTDEE